MDRKPENFFLSCQLKKYLHWKGLINNSRWPNKTSTKKFHIDEIEFTIYHEKTIYSIESLKSYVC